MQYALVYTLLAAVAGSLVSAQDLSQIPPCAQQAALSSISSSGCQYTDFACICRNQAFLDSLLPVVQKACSPADLQKILSITQNLCLAVSVTISVPNPASVTSAAGAATTAAAPVTSGAASVASAVSSLASALSSAASAATATGSQSRTPTSATSSPSSSTSVTAANSGSRFASAGGLMGAIAVAVAVVGLN